jgi:hypothetical protein
MVAGARKFEVARVRITGGREAGALGIGEVIFNPCATSRSGILLALLLRDERPRQRPRLASRSHRLQLEHRMPAQESPRTTAANIFLPINGRR